MMGITEKATLLVAKAVRRSGLRYLCFDLPRIPAGHGMYNLNLPTAPCASIHTHCPYFYINIYSYFGHKKCTYLL